MSTIESYLEVIHHFYPDLRLTTAAIHREGQYNDVLVVDRYLVFRFPKVPQAVETLQREVMVLQHLQGQLPLPVPNPKFTQLGSSLIGEVFAGYDWIPGQPLWRDVFRGLPKGRVRSRLAVQFAEFLKALHVAELPPSVVANLPHRDGPEEWRQMYDRVREELFARMRPEARQQVANQFESYLDQEGGFPFRPLLRHGDFGTGNVLYDPQKLELCGVLDFGGVGIGDPAVDFAGLFISYGEAFYRMAAVSYPEMEQALERVHFYCGTFALQEALFGLENGDEAAYRAGMQGLV